MISILYVDDETALLDIAKQFIERMGQFRVDTATSAPEAIEKIRKNSYEAVISDYQMPDMDGIAFLKIFRKEYPKLPFIMFTGKGREDIAVEAFENGADFYVQKGGQFKAQFSELLVKVNAAVNRRKTEKALLKSEEKYRNLIDRATDGIVVLQDSRIQYCNQHSADFVGYSVMELMGRLFHDFVAQEELPKLKEYYAKRISGEQFPGTYDTMLIRKDGSKVFAELNAGIVDYEGQPADLLILRDITERKRMEEDLLKKNADLNLANEKLSRSDVALHRREEKFRMIFDTAPNLIISVNREGIIVDCNQRVQDVLGYEKTEITGQSLAKILYQEDFTRAQDCLTGIMTAGTVYNRHYKMMKKDGHIIDVSINSTGIKDKSGRYFRTVCIIDDITERLAALELLSRKEEKFRNIFDTAMNLVASVNLEGIIVDCNRRVRDFLGYEKAEIIGQSISRVIHPDDIKQVHDGYAEILKTGVYYNKIYRMIKKDGTFISVSINATGIKDRQGKYFRIVCIIDDITARLLAEETLRVTREKYMKVFLAAPDAITLSEYDTGQFAECNDAASIVFGYSRDELIGKRASDLGIFLKEEDRDAWIRQIITQGRMLQYELIERRKSGEEFNASIAADTIIIDNIRYIIAITRDITAQKRTEEALRASETRYKNVVEDQTEFIARFLPDGTHVFVNEAYLRYFNKTRDEVIGHILFPNIPKEDRMILKKHFAALTPANPVTTVNHRTIMPDGTVHWQRWSDRAVFDQAGALVEYQSVGRDITEQKLVEEAFRNSDQLMRSIIDHLPDATLVVDKNGTVLAWNHAMEELTEVRAKQIVGKGNYEYALPFYHERRPITIDLILNEDPAIVAKYPVMKKEGRSLFSEIFIPHLNRGKGAYLWFTASPLYDKDGKLSGAIETIRDITDHKQEEVRLNHANRQLNLLTRVTRHDILNQLLALKGYLELSPEFLHDPDRLLQFITKEQKITSVIEDQINLTREYEEVGVKAPVWQNVNDCVLKAIAHLPMRNIHVAFDRPDLEILADPLFEKVTYNLIDNALRYGGDQLKEIRVSSHVDSPNLVLVYEDDGAGVSANEKSHIFERGFGKHTGMGLFISREILSITNIKIIENGTFGKGARFELNVPKGSYRFNADKQ
ncbi:MAG: PAS domain S-box protein [Methanoregula sp.]|nr:PAS domain S-box protein [Methanoregula sp.]